MVPIRILALGGDGIGPEVVTASLDVLDVAARANDLTIHVEEDLLHGAAYDRYGTFCHDETVTAAKAADAVLVGSVGGPQWENLFPGGTPAEKDGLVRLRQELDVFAGLRPARSYPALLNRTPFKPDVVRDADIMVLRELCGGLYFGEPRGIDQLPDGSFQGYDANFYTSHEIERIARVGFELARRRRGQLVSIDKANVMESGVLWRRIVDDVSIDFPDVTLSHMFADNAMYQMACNPRSFDVMLGDNLLGDIASDLAAVLAGSLGMLPSASLSGLAPVGERSSPAIYESVHGSAPDIAGQGIANPMATILSVAMLFEYSLARKDIAEKIEQAALATLDAGLFTPDLGGTETTRSLTDHVIREFRAL